MRYLKDEFAVGDHDVLGESGVCYAAPSETKSDSD
jgi:hypothetical protein